MLVASEVCNRPSGSPFVPYGRAAVAHVIRLLFGLLIENVAQYFLVLVVAVLIELFSDRADAINSNLVSSRIRYPECEVEPKCGEFRPPDLERAD
jgi:hypothetical protein